LPAAAVGEFLSDLAVTRRARAAVIVSILEGACSIFFVM